jgi:hypothetical protein
MSKYRVNRAAVEKAQSMIDANQYVLDSEWSDAQPSTETQNEHLRKLGWEDYGKWFLAIDTEASEETKGRYNFEYGDFDRVHRSGLIAAKQRAAQNDHAEVERAADRLLEHLDAVRA